jgi:hypothetical protein
MRDLSRFVTRALLAGTALTGAILGAVPAAAQVTPSDVRDLVGARAAGGESELAARGYVNVRGQTGDDRKWTYWWNGSRGVCLSVATMNGRYDSIIATPAPDCGQGSGQNGGRQPEPTYAPTPGDRPHAADRPGYGDRLALVCYGEGQKPTATSRSGYEWDDHEHRYVPRTRTEWTTQQYDSSVTVEIDGNTGRIRPAKNMIPPIHSDSDNGWYDLSDVEVGRDQIRGRFKLNGANRPKVTINRDSGRITLDGLTKFSGSCDPIDAGDHRRF